MVEGGSDEFIENLVKYIREKPDFASNLEDSLKDNEEFKKMNKEFKELTIEDVNKLLKNDKNLLDTVVEYFTENKKDLEALLEQASKVRGMKEKLEALGDQLLINRIIGGAAFTTLTGALAGTLAIGGVAGALVTGGAALVGFFALIAITAIVHAVYKHRDEIKESVDKSASKAKESTVEWGKLIKSLLKDFIDKLPTIQAKENNFTKLRKDLLDQYRKSNTEEQEKLNNKIEVIGMLQEEGSRWAIQQLVESEEIKDFPKEDMKRLIDKGTSTHESDMEALKDLMKKFQPAIMAIGNNEIKEVKQKINKKVQEMTPGSEVVTTADPSNPFPSTKNLRKN